MADQEEKDLCFLCGHERDGHTAYSGDRIICNKVVGLVKDPTQQDEEEWMGDLEPLEVYCPCAGFTTVNTGGS